MPTITPPGPPYMYGRSEPRETAMDVHWQQPDGTLACGAPHLDWHDAYYHTCCRRNPARVSCPGCLQQVKVDRIISELAVAS